jgi:hypothetical protein
MIKIISQEDLIDKIEILWLGHYFSKEEEYYPIGLL